MKRVLVILLVLLAFFVPTMGQENPLEGRVMPKDSLPDLWVVTIDMTASMRENDRYSLIPQRLSELINNCNYDVQKGCFLILRSGMTKKELRSSTPDMARYFHLRYEKKDFTSLLIRDDGLKLMNYDQASEAIRNLCQNGKPFKYERSFASIARPVSIHFLVKEKNFDFSRYRNIYHILITDNGDDNDQWGEEYSFLRKHYKEHFFKIKGILPTIACSNFDFVSAKTGKFEEIVVIDDMPYVFLTRYATYQNEYPDKFYKIDSLVTVKDFHDQSFTFVMKPNHDSVSFVYIDTCSVNGHKVAVNQYLYSGDSIKIKYDKSFGNAFHNSLALKWSYQELYNDRILGLCYRKVSLDDTFADHWIPIETKVKEHTILQAAVVLLLAILLFIHIRRNQVVLRIFVNGQLWKIKRKAMKRMRHDSFTLLTVIFDEQRMTDAVFYKGRNITIKDNDETVRNEGRIVIKSRKRLKVEDHIFVCEEDKRGKNITLEFDIEEVGASFQFHYVDSLSHNLVISLTKKEKIRVENPENPLRERNLQMLAKYYEGNAAQICTLHNNVMVNIIRKETMGKGYKKDYAVLNIYDLNSQKSAARIFLRYSLMCVFDREVITEEAAAKRMMKIAHYVLRSEGQRRGYWEKAYFTEVEDLESGIMVDVSPMLSYLYLCATRKKRLVYSPFCDGRLGLSSKSVKIFPKESMVLLNLPIKHPHPELKLDDDNTAAPIDRRYRKEETMFFRGTDVIKFVKETPMNYAYGRNGFDINGKTFLAWKIDDIIFKGIV